MGQQHQTKSIVREKNFFGLVSALDEHDLPPGAAQDVVNITVTNAGKLTTRNGYRLLIFEDLA